MNLRRQIIAGYGVLLLVALLLVSGAAHKLSGEVAEGEAARSAGSNTISGSEGDDREDRDA